MSGIHITEYNLLSSFFLITGKAGNAYILKTQKPQTKWYPPAFIFESPLFPRQSVILKLCGLKHYLEMPVSLCCFWRDCRTAGFLFWAP